MGLLDETLEGTATTARVLGVEGYALTLGYRGERNQWTWERARLVGEVRLGRGCEVFDAPLHDPCLSRDHARLTLRAAGWVLSDRESRNGSFVNGKRVRRSVALQSGDVVRLGDSLMFFERITVGVSPFEEQVTGLITRAPIMTEVRRTVCAAAPRQQTVLISGETGTGKELVAHALHALSGRTGAFVPVNCAALGEESPIRELFGRVDEERVGLLEAASGGTLFLDEVGEMPAGFQAALLRALEDGQVRRVGSDVSRALNIRVVCATNGVLEAQVRAGMFRKDLYARLAQCRVRLPPLRERRSDIPLIAQAVLDRLGAGRRPIDVPLAERLVLHDWPLNVRGLLIALDNAVMSSARMDELMLTPEIEAFLSALREPAPQVKAATSSAPDQAERGLMAMPGKETLITVLKENRGQIARSARALSCTRQKIYRWAAAYELDLEDFRVL